MLGWYMDLAERLHKSLAEVYAMDRSELALWMARDQQKAEQQKRDNLIARAEAARRKR